MIIIINGTDLKKTKGFNTPSAVEDEELTLNKKSIALLVSELIELTEEKDDTID